MARLKSYKGVGIEEDQRPRSRLILLEAQSIEARLPFAFSYCRVQDLNNWITQRFLRDDCRSVCTRKRTPGAR